MCSSNLIDPAVSSLLAAQDASLRTQISFAVAGKQQDAAQQEGSAINALLEQSLQLSKSLVSGQLFDAVG
jgi:hypothetical protein